MPKSETVASSATSPEVKALWEEVRDVLRNEEAWAIIGRALKAAEERGMKKAWEYHDAGGCEEARRNL